MGTTKDPSTKKEQYNTLIKHIFPNSPPPWGSLLGEVQFFSLSPWAETFDDYVNLVVPSPSQDPFLRGDPYLEKVPCLSLRILLMFGHTMSAEMSGIRNMPLFFFLGLYKRKIHSTI